MTIFNRNQPNNVMAKGEKSSEADDNKPEKEPEKMENSADSKSSLLDIMPSKRRGEGPSAAAGAPASGGGNETHISGDTTFEGKLVAKGELVIDGSFSGDIKSTSRVVIGTAGKVEGTVDAKSMVISGRVIGNLKVHERLELLSTGEIFGDLETQPGALIVEKGARLEGKCTMGLSPDQDRRPQQQSQPQPKADEKKNGGK